MKDLKKVEKAMKVENSLYLLLLLPCAPWCVHLKQPRRNSDRYHYCYGNLYRYAGSPDRQDAPEPFKQNRRDLDRDHHCYRNVCRAGSPGRHEEPEHLKQTRRNSE